MSTPTCRFGRGLCTREATVPGSWKPESTGTYPKVQPPPPLAWCREHATLLNLSYAAKPAPYNGRTEAPGPQRLSKAERTARVIEFVQKIGRPITTAEVAEAAGVKQSAVYRILDHAISTGAIRRDQKGKFSAEEPQHPEEPAPADQGQGS